MVLIKYDLLVMDHYRACCGMPDGEVEAKKRAEHALSEVTKELKELGVLYAPVSTQKRWQKEYEGRLIRSITSLFYLK